MQNGSVIFFIVIYQIFGDTDDTRFVKERVVGKLSAAQHIKRQESHASGAVLFEESDAGFRVFRCLRDNILDGTAECDFNGDFVFFARAEQFGDNAAHPGKFLGVVGFRLHDGAHPGVVSFVSRLQLLQGFEA